MHAGRKILNLRCDRKISQQDLARACQITPSALSKIEAGINAPRANIIWRLAQNLGVTVEYLLDEEIPYPYPAYQYRQNLLESRSDPKSKTRKEVTLEEAAFLDALRDTNEIAREIAFALPEAHVETVRMMHFLVHDARIQNPGPAFWNSFRDLLTSGDQKDREYEVAKEKGRERQKAATTKKKTAKKKAKAAKKKARKKASSR
ncbi:MAG: helix-turn-helix transcriptional regulator [Planctomycetota bacterium]